MRTAATTNHSGSVGKRTANGKHGRGQTFEEELIDRLGPRWIATSISWRYRGSGGKIKRESSFYV